MKWKCLLVDDEPLAIEVLQSHIESVEQLEVVGTCNSAFKAMEFLKDHHVDLIFLDIHMPKLTGTAFMKTIQSPPKVIFTTAFKEYAADAFELNAIDYLLKPISLERFLRAVNKLPNINLGESTNKETLPENSGFTYFRSDRKMIKLFYDEIVYIESVKDYIKIFRDGNNPILVKQTISATEDMLPKNLFLRIHRSYIVSIKKISAYTYYDVEIGKIEIPIGRLYRPELKKLSHIRQKES
ncbi:MAG TPA: LytTR family DNA-binding domain-containing protein [Chitinophagaceae bacterium]|nr:LytTR family DNA-binding domain-containing protein [Chitinophagaceae bacterium]